MDRQQYKSKIKLFYRIEQVLQEGMEKSISKSPIKPKLLIEYLENGCGQDLLKQFDVIDFFNPLSREDFMIAHTEEYVNAILYGISPQCASNGLPWSKELARSVTYTNASLYYAIKEAVFNPQHITFSPTSGFHHAKPTSGGGFCTFSGQVVASVMLYNESRKRGAYLDLDGHFGNSIEDSRSFVPKLSEAIPEGFNINPTGYGESYIESLVQSLNKLEKAIYEGKIDYLVWCHGADSCSEDDMHGQVSMEEWLKCSTIFYSWVKDLNLKRKCLMPITLTLFGGYRADDYNSVLALHTADLVACLNTLCRKKVKYVPDVKPKKRENTR